MTEPTARYIALIAIALVTCGVWAVFSSEFHFMIGRTIRNSGDRPPDEMILFIGFLLSAGALVILAAFHKRAFHVLVTLNVVFYGSLLRSGYLHSLLFVELNEVITLCAPLAGICLFYYAFLVYDNRRSRTRDLPSPSEP